MRLDQLPIVFLGGLDDTLSRGPLALNAADMDVPENRPTSESSAPAAIGISTWAIG